MNVLIAKAIAVALLVAGLIFGFNVFVEHQRDIGYHKRVAEDAVQLNADLQAAREQTERMFRIHDKAIAEGAQREQALKTQLSSARAVSVSLRDDLERTAGVYGGFFEYKMPDEGVFRLG